MNSTYLRLLDGFEKKRQILLDTALGDAKRWCVAPEDLVDKKRADQYWLRLLGTSQIKLCSSEIHRFLVGFQLTTRVRWDVERVVREVDSLRRRAVSDIREEVTELAKALAKCISSKNGGRQTSAASKICFFAKPDQEVFIWDKWAARAARLRDFQRTNELPLRIKKPYSLSSGEHDYATYAEACANALREERDRPDFAENVEQFRAYLMDREGPMKDRLSIQGDTFIERRLLDKLMFHEGKWTDSIELHG